MLEHHVMPLAWQHPNVLWRVVGLVTVTVMHNLARREITLEYGRREQTMDSNGLAVLPCSRVRISFVTHWLILHDPGRKIAQPA